MPKISPNSLILYIKLIFLNTFNLKHKCNIPVGYRDFMKIYQFQNENNVAKDFLWLIFRGSHIECIFRIDLFKKQQI